MADNTDDTKDVPPYTPDEDDRKLIRLVTDKYDKWTELRRPYESSWYLTAAFFRGNQYVYWHAADQRLATPQAPRHRIRLAINKVFSKVRARQAKFLKNRPVPIVMPATSELKDRQRARATTKALDYIWRKMRLEVKYRDALAWASIASRGLWWYHWDDTKLGRVQLTNAFGQKSVVDAPLGDVSIEVGSPFELLVPDLQLSNLCDQPEIMRTKVRAVDEIRARYPESGVYVQGETADDPSLRFERQISTLNAQTLGSFNTGTDAKLGPDGKATHAIVKEWFCAPTGDYPKGRYVVVANGVLLKSRDELPYGFHDMTNPYPVTDFPDLLQAGQFWCTTVAEQVLPLQREYNLLRSKIGEQVRIMAHPKLLVAKQHQMPPCVWSSEAGEMVEYVALPNVPPPQTWTPPNIAQDVWRSLEALNQEFDDIFHIFPEAEGRVGQSTSGFQTNLLQEATDAVHAPDIRMHELAIEEAAFKIRRLMKQGYDVARLITVTGQDLQPEVIEFSAEDIDEHADIIVQAGSALPMLKGARIQSVMELYNIGLLGNQQDPEVKRRALAMLEMSTVDDAYNYARRDEDQARIENDLATEGRLEHQPDSWEDHQLHYRVHTDLLKSSTTHEWPTDQRTALISHLILHVKFMNPQSAVGLALHYQLPDLVRDVMPQPGVPPGPQGPPGQPPQAPPGGPPSELPTGPAGPAPAPPEAAFSGANQANPESGFGPQGAEAMSVFT